MALLSGATLVLAPQAVLASPLELAVLLRKQHITVVTLPPSVLAVMPAEGQEQLASVISAGERCPADLAGRWAEGRRFVNAYGPTEATIGPTMHVVSAVPEGAGSVPIGRPIRNIRITLLDRYGQPVPVGVPGEIHIGGVGVARGYLRRPGLTAEKFVPDPWTGAGERRRQPSTRVYRTGDLARWLPDGTLEVLGRVDHQVKVRGFRIELGEIEAALRGLAGVREAVVLAREDGQGDLRLVAYVVADQGAGLAATGLRDHLRDVLPEYMVPPAYLVLEQMPLTPNGKVDRQALLALPEPGREGLGEGYVAPRDGLEAQLARVWQEVLGLELVGVRDDFFQLGGHSLLAVRLMARMADELGVEVPLVALFQQPTVELLAGLLRQEHLAALTSPLVPLKPSGSRPPLFFIHPSGGSVHWYGDLAGRMAEDQPFYGLQAQGLMGEVELDTTIAAMAERYVAEMRRVQPAGPYHLGSWSMGVAIALEVAQQLLAAGERVGLLAMLDQGPFHPDEVPVDDAEYLTAFFGGRLPIAVETLRAMDPVAQLEHVMSEAKGAGWMFPDVTLPQFRHFVEILKTHERAWRAYRPQPYAGRITLFRARERTIAVGEPPDLGWAAIATGGVDIVEVPGDHNTMLHDPHLAELAKAIESGLDPTTG